MPKTCLDHIIVLIPYQDLINPPEWLTQIFTLTPGGQHAGGRTENRLVCFQDGSYLELIAFINDLPEHRAGHFWGAKKPGIIDFAFSSAEDADSHYEALNDRLLKLEILEGKIGIAYDKPVDGGRLREDGVAVKWKVTFPPASLRRGEVPFFCHDVTARELRVPGTGDSVRHPCGAKGVRDLSVILPEESLNDLAKIYSAILDVEEDAEGGFRVGSVHSVEGSSGPTIRLLSPSSQEEEALVAERGLVLGNLKVVGNDSINLTRLNTWV
ncbi:hypothetical protein B7494_g743 [Chlorociboria aeruginascens]|nr:hypothetical protein B7494_g743 [Chlorociboria aeruginascens]